MPRVRPLLLLLTLAALPACVARTVDAGRAADRSVGPPLVLDRFLRAANENDLETMARLFGTEKGSIVRRDGEASAQERMFILASLLRHDDYVIEGNEVVPGRLQTATRLLVRMRFGDRSVVVPFTIVRSRDEWLVERIGIERITGS